jgi:hypothetical protein
VLVAAPLAGSALFAGHALRTIGCGPLSRPGLGLAAFALALAATAFAVGALLPAGRPRP